MEKLVVFLLFSDPSEVPGYCNGDVDCIYDKFVTGSDSIAMATQRTNKMTERQRNAFAARTPQWNNPFEPIEFSTSEDAAWNLGDLVKFDEQNIDTDSGVEITDVVYEIDTDIFDDLYTFSKFSLIFK